MIKNHSDTENKNMKLKEYILVNATYNNKKLSHLGGGWWKNWKPIVIDYKFIADIDFYVDLYCNTIEATDMKIFKKTLESKSIELQICNSKLDDIKDMYNNAVEYLNLLHLFPLPADLELHIKSELNSVIDKFSNLQNKVDLLTNEIKSLDLSNANLYRKAMLDKLRDVTMWLNDKYIQELEDVNNTNEYANTLLQLLK